MSEWSTYSPSDFLLFSERAYVRMLEIGNAALWPGHLVAFAAGLFLIFALLRPTPKRVRAAYAVLGVAWLLLAWSFFWERYAAINWAARYLAPVIAAQGLLLVALAVRGRPSVAVARPGAVPVLAATLLGFAISGYPLLTLLLDRPWQAAEVLGIAPDPTAVATLAVLAASRGAATALAMAVPVLWCLVTGLTLHTLGTADFFVAPAAALVAVMLRLASRPAAFA